MIVDILRNISLFVDGRGYAGQVDECIPPKLTVKTEDFRAGGMDGTVEIDQGLEKLEATLQMSGVDRALLEQWGVTLAAMVPMTIRGALQSEDGTVRAAVIHLRGRIKEIDYGTWKPGEKVPMKAMVSVWYYKLEHGGATIHEVDVENMIRIVNGVDQLAEMRAALAI